MAGSNSVTQAEAPEGGAGMGSGVRSGVAALSAVIGTGYADTLLGGDGPDYVDGRGGDDTASGAGGDDVVLGGSGDDSLAGDGGLEFPGTSFRADDDVLWGGAGDDTLYGDGFFYSSQFEGTASNVLFGGPGNDQLRGGYGGDVIDGGSGDDAITGYGSVTLQLGGSPGAGREAANTDLADFLTGGSGDDFISGGGGADTMFGGAGDDSLAGGFGNDRMSGGAGADRFFFDDEFSLSSDTGQGVGNRDVVLDFRTGEDKLDFIGYRGLGIRWEYEEGGDLTIVYITNRFGPTQPEGEIELRRVRDLAPDDIIF